MDNLVIITVIDFYRYIKMPTKLSKTAFIEAILLKDCYYFINNSLVNIADQYR